MDDTLDLCCAAGICCDDAKRLEKLAALLREKVPHLSEHEALKVAATIHDLFDLLPKDLGFGPAIANLVKLARETEYN